MYAEEDYLLLSGIQHFVFCRRQWALIHIEQQWQENMLTVEGMFLHEKAHKDRSEQRGDTIIARSMPVFSATLGIRGECDIVEFHLCDDGVELSGRQGKYLPMPIEYKRGRPKEHDADVLQMCAQAMCLEEMLVCSITRGCLYYAEQHHRLDVLIDDIMRERVRSIFEEMHALFRRGYTPKAKPTKACKSCSLDTICLPKLAKQQSVRDYLARAMAQGDEA